MRGFRARASTLVFAALASACSMTRVVEVPESQSLYDRVPDARMADFRAAREQFLRGDAAQARAGFERLLDREPDVVTIGVWWQECQSLLAGPEELRRRSAERAEFAPSVGVLILAARAEPDPIAAETWLARAEAFDPDCAWVHHARAFLAFRDGRLDDARLALERALASDPGHLAARRLEIRVLARDGATEAARSRLAGWIERAADDSRVLPRDLAEAHLDRALLAIGAQELGDAEESLNELDPKQVEPWRLSAARAVLAQERGDVEAARRHVEDARARAPAEILPAVQEALLFDEPGGDPYRARAAWIAVRELAAQRSDLAGAFETVRARVRLERLDREAASPTSP